MAADPTSAPDWASFLKALLGWFVGGLVAVVAFMWLMNPFGNLPRVLNLGHVMTDEHQRFQYPAVIRSHRFDSLVIGTSTARLLNPSELEKVLPGHFAQLSMNSATAWEQAAITKLFLRHTTRALTLIVGLDTVWCDPRADLDRITRRGFPDWLYGESRWRDLPHMLNGQTLETAARRLGFTLGLVKARLAPNGYGVFVPAEGKYDLAKAQEKIWGAVGPRDIVPVDPAYRASEAELASWSFPALPWLAEILAGDWQEKLLVQMPTHVSAQSVPGSKAAAIDAACRSRIAAIATQYGADLIDFRIASPLTTRDENYWDSLHYRVPVAARLASEIGRAVATGADDPGGDWRYVTGPPRRSNSAPSPTLSPHE